MLIPGKSYKGKLPPLTVSEEACSERMKADVFMLAEEIGIRNTENPIKLMNASNFIESRFSGLGYSVHREKYIVSELEVANIVAEMRGIKKPEQIIIIGAHYDSAPGTPGADDNASGVAALLELASQLKDCRPDYTVRFVAFVNEEPPYCFTELMGSYISALGCWQREEKITAMLCLESVGYYSSTRGSQIYPPPLEKLYPDTADFIVFCSNIASFPLLRRCIKHFRRTTQFPSEGLVAPEKFVAPIGWSDHRAFWQMGYPAVMITDTAFLRNPHYHLSSDIPKYLDYESMARVTGGIERVIQKLAC